MEPSPIQEKQKPSWDKKYEKVQERIKESFWGDFIFGGLLISGIFIIVDNLNLPQETNIIIGLLIIILAISLMLGRLGWLKSIRHRINKMMDKAQISFETTNYIKSINYLERIIRIDEIYSPAWNNKGIALSNLGKDKDAIECYDKAIKIDEKDADVWNNKGIALSNLGKDKDAIECYDKAIEIDEKYAYAWNNKGKVLYKLGRNEDAIECYDKAIEIDEKYAYAWNNKGTALYKLGRNEDAIECYYKAIEIDEKYAYTWYNKGTALYKLGRNEDAIECYDKAIEIDEKDAYAWYIYFFCFIFIKYSALDSQLNYI